MAELKKDKPINMNLLTRPSFIQTIGQISSANDPHHTLIYTEINPRTQNRQFVAGHRRRRKAD